MPIRLNDLEMPKPVVKEESSARSKTFGRYVAEPFEIGYARTIGNSLRRVLLSSIEGCAISSVKIAGAPHEFCSLKGVKEDVTEIVLALKKVLVSTEAREKTVTVKRKGPCEVTAGDLADGTHDLEVLNPDHHIATVNDGAEFEMEVKITRGRGFRPAEWDADPNDPNGRPRQTVIGVIPLDRIYSPVVRVNFDVGNCRVGQKTDYERLTLDITTDGRVDPDKALVHAAVILSKHLDVFINYNKDLVADDAETDAVAASSDDLRAKLNLSVNEIELSVRSANCLNNANITTVGELCQKQESDMLKYRNFGKKSLLEIKDKLTQMGLSLGMKFDPALLKK
ncbi:MAG: DNA-directed RNA polymerase subunit alpha [Kiritimatiellae bacterium]|nr:DNA-directed RNA polymerase subunit alpha [Kiritimatiellia bacterium]